MSWCGCAHIILGFFGGTEQQLKTTHCLFITQRHVMAKEMSFWCFRFVCCIHCFPIYAFQTIPHTRSSLCLCITINNCVSYLTLLFCFQPVFRIQSLSFVFVHSIICNFHSQTVPFPNHFVFLCCRRLFNQIRGFFICKLFVLGCIHLFVL